MSRIEELIAELCPDGVEYYQLGELGKFYSGLTGKSKSDFVGGNAKFITYRNVYSNPALKLDIDDTVKIGVEEKQRTLEYGDVIFTGSSETEDECGMSSVLNIKTDEKLYLNSFCFIFRFDNPSIMLPDFSKHLFRSSNLRYQIGKTASGVTRYNVSKTLMEKVVVPVPPLEVQREIVRVLDSFTLLTAELTAELTARKKQYDFYRNKLLTFDVEIEYKSLEEIAVNRCTGGTPLKANRDFYEGGNIPWLRTQEVVYNEIKSTECFITEEAVKKTSAKWIPVNCVIVAISGASAGRCAINKIPLTTNQHCLNIEVNVNIVDYKYVYYCLCNQYEELVGKKEGARGDLSVARIMSLKIPIPSLDSQKRIVAILDRFDILCNNISLGLPAEIEARRKQYEYYRDKLLSF